MRYLIDGYNLLHAMGLLHANRVGPHTLEKARLALLGRLAGHLAPQGNRITIVFDASGGRRGGATELDYQGIHIYYAVHEEADDLIAELIDQDPAPRQLTVVSNDHRVQQAARRRQCQVLGSLDFLDRLESPPQTPRSTKDAEAKPEGVSRAETQHWLQEFADLVNDGRLDEISDVHFLDEDE
jgi:predicted RNA-binding protein with PIN domain